MSSSVTYSSNKEFIDSRSFRFGDLFIVDDSLVSIPQSDRIPGCRTIHPERWVVVVSNNSENHHPLCPVVTVIPLSHRTDLKRLYDVELFCDKDNVKVNCLTQTKLMQPMLKKDLGKHKGTISPDKQAELYMAISNVFGFDE